MERSSRRTLAQREMARRMLARRRLIDFAEYTFGGYRAAAVHRLLAEYLEQVEAYVASGGREGIGRLMVFMPPRHGKSELVSVRFPPWFLGRNPDCRVILSSCTGDLAVGFSRQVRNIIIDRPYQALFGDHSGCDVPLRLSEDSRAANAWDFAYSRGGMVAAGVGGAIIGRGAHLAVIDDPFRDRNDAESQAVRDRVDDWYRSTLYTRLEEGAAVVLMHQRWHEDDLAGRLLKRMADEEGADQWTVLCLPGVAEEWAERIEPERVIEACRNGWWMGVDPLGRAPGEPLWAEKYPLEALARIEAVIGGYEWDALYQQRPRQLEGAVIKAHLIQVVEPHQVPEDLTLVRYWDLAVSGRDKADYIAGAKCGRSRKGHFYILDLAHMRGPWADARPKMCKIMHDDGPGVSQGIEVRGQQLGYYQEFVRDEGLQGLAFEAVDPQKVGNKEVRANLWASRIEDGLIYMVRGPWNKGLVSEALGFPRAAHDDRVDAVSGAWQMIPATVSWGDIREAPDTASRWDPFGERRELVGGWHLSMDTGERVRILAEFSERVKISAETGDLIDSLALQYIEAGHIEPREAGNIMARMAAEYIDKGQDIKAMILLSERKRLGL